MAAPRSDDHAMDKVLGSISPCAFIPDGTYFLHADDGRVHQLKSTSGEWECLATS